MHVFIARKANRTFVIESDGWFEKSQVQLTGLNIWSASPFHSPPINITKSHPQTRLMLLGNKTTLKQYVPYGTGYRRAILTPFPMTHQEVDERQHNYRYNSASAQSQIKSDIIRYVATSEFNLTKHLNFKWLEISRLYRRVIFKLG